jgi:CRP-like cAMP-binding protein
MSNRLILSVFLCSGDAPKKSFGTSQGTSRSASTKKGGVVYKEGEIPGLLYVVQKGSVEITKKTSDGHQQTIAVIQSGHFFGELSFFGKRTHAARAVALSDSRVVVLSRFS